MYTSVDLNVLNQRTVNGHMSQANNITCIILRTLPLHMPVPYVFPYLKVKMEDTDIDRKKNLLLLDYAIQKC
jgi:hypothetical protein